MGNRHVPNFPLILLVLTPVTWTQPVPMLQLSPEQCRASLTQCPSLGSGTGHADLDFGIAMFKMQYEARLRQLRSYFDRAIEAVIADPSASLGATLCAFLPEEFVHAGSKSTTTTRGTATATTPVTPSGPLSSPDTSSTGVSVAAPQTTTVTQLKQWPSETEPEISAVTGPDAVTSEEPTMSQTMTDFRTQTPDQHDTTTGIKLTEAMAPQTTTPRTATPSTTEEPKPETTVEEHQTTLELETTQASREADTSTAEEPNTATTPSTTQRLPTPEEPATTRESPTTPESSTTENPRRTHKEPAVTTDSAEPADTTARSTNNTNLMTPTTTVATPTTAHQEMTTTPNTPDVPPATTEGDRCRVAAWSHWSAAFGFGRQRRKREITLPGVTCPEREHLVEDRDMPVSTDGAGNNLFENITVVGDNFYRDFLRSTTSPRDILLVIDASGGVGQTAAEARTNGLTQLLDLICGGFGNDDASNHLGIIKFAYMASGLIQLGDDQSPDLLKDIVGSVRSTYTDTCTGKALQMAYTMFDEQFGARPESIAAHDTLLVVDGKSDCDEDLLPLSQQLQTRSNISVIAIGLGDNMAARDELQLVVSNQDPRHIYPLASYTDLEAMMALLMDTHGVAAGC